jgi:hypothetical protein
LHAHLAVHRCRGGEVRLSLLPLVCSEPVDLKSRRATSSGRSDEKKRTSKLAFECMLSVSFKQQQRLREARIVAS